MDLTRHHTPTGPRLALDGRFLTAGTTLGAILGHSAATLADALRALTTDEPATGVLLPPVDPDQEVWAAGVTYLSSRMAREAESQSSDVYQRVYHAARPELFFKSTGTRAVGHLQPIRIRRDSRWDVPEPELTLVLNAAGEIVGFTVGNDVSSRSIEGENPLYLPQAKTYSGSCAVGPAIRLCTPESLHDVPIHLAILRDGAAVFSGETRTSQIKRPLEELAGYLFRELDFPRGALLMTGTGIIPGEDFTLAVGDVVRITIAGMVLENPVA
jgi:2-dehydro-3-deoxy-D-arabinonate dehydratase